MRQSKKPFNALAFPREKVRRRIATFFESTLNSCTLIREFLVYVCRALSLPLFPSTMRVAPGKEEAEA